MFDLTSLTIFIAASLALLVMPGPAVFYIVARSIEQGRLAGLVSTLGVTFASVIHVIFAALGLSALIMQSAVMFSIIKYLGAVYLIYLGIRTLLSKNQPIKTVKLEPLKLRQIFWQGFIVNMLNPKTAIFFLAFLPQFVNPANGSVPLQFIFLGMIFLILAITSDSIYALIAGTAKDFLASSQTAIKMQKYFSSTIYIGLGITTALFSINRSE